MRASRKRVRRRLTGVPALVAVLLMTACSAHPPEVAGTVAFIPGYQGGPAGAPPVEGYPSPIPVVTATLTDTSSTKMSIELSQPYAPAGKVSFLITNAGTMDHEMVVLKTDQPAGSFDTSTGFEGEPNRFNEDAKGLTNVGETGDPAMKPGTQKMLTIDMATGHYAIVCNLSGHYAAGMHQDFFVTPKGSTPVTATLADTSSTKMSIELSQPYAPAGKVSFLITNAGTMDHEMVVLKTDQPAGSFDTSTGFEGEPNRFNEDAKGLTNVGETGDPAMKPGTQKMLTIDMATGHYAIVCNLSGHYAAGMHQDFFVTPKGSTPVTATLADTSSTKMSIELSQPYAPAGKVSFLITNAGTMDHEMVVLKTDQPAGSFDTSTGFEGEPNRFNEDAKGLTNVGETGDPAMKPGTQKMLTIDMATGHYAIVCNLSGHYAAGMHQDFFVTPKGSTPVTATLADTSSTKMSIELSQPYAPAGKVSFLITNAGTMDHEMVVLKTDQPAGSFDTSTGFEGEPNRFNEDAKGLTNVGETGDPAMKPGTQKMLTIDMATGHYAIVCNLSGHYAAGMHQDFFVTPKGSTPVTATLADTSSTKMSIELSQPYAPAGKVSFLITNAGTMDHEMVVLKTDQPAGSFDTSTGFEGEPNRFNEDAKGLTNVGETGDPAMKPGTQKMLTIDMATGHYAIVCNLSGHYAAGMHQDFFVTPAVPAPAL